MSKGRAVDRTKKTRLDRKWLTDEKGGFYVGSVIDAVIPTANAANPVKEDILTKGVKRQSFIDIYITGGITNWKENFL